MTTVEEFKARRKRHEKIIAEALHGAASELSRAKSYLFDLTVRANRNEFKKWYKFYAELDLMLYHITQDLENISDKVNGRPR